MIQSIKIALLRTSVLALLVLAACGGGTGSGSTEAVPQAVEAPKAEALSGGAMQGLGERLKPRRAIGTAARALSLPDAASERLKAQSSQTTTGVGPFKIGFAREVAALDSPGKATALLDWTALAGGRRVASISLTSPEAVAVRLGMMVRRLPPEAIVRVYAQGAVLAYELMGSEILLALQRNVNADSSDAQLYWLPVVEGQEATVEFELPAAVAPASLEIALPRLSHLYRSPATATTDGREQPKIGEADYCERDVSCDATYSNESNSVAKMAFVIDGDSYQCSGTLLNDSANSFTPHFLTASHCISTQAVASTLQTYWFYRSPSCNARSLNPGSRTLVGGAVLLRTDVFTDVTLVRLNDPPPAGAYYSGWMASAPSLFADVSGVHHPEGDLQKISKGAIDAFKSCTRVSANGYWDCFSTDAVNSNFLSAIYSSGTIEPGSSGSPLYRSVGTSRYVIGQASASLASCSNRDGITTYGRFDVSYRSGLKTSLGGNITTAGSGAAVGSGPGRSAVYRFYNSQTGAHFYTISAEERDSVIANLKQFRYEAPAFYAYIQPGPDLSPVYRFYNPQTGAHFYTIGVNERDYVIANLAQFRYEGPVWYARQTAAEGATALYRFFRTTNNAHFYTPDPAERDYVIKNLSDFRYEGPAYYVWTGP